MPAWSKVGNIKGPTGAAGAGPSSVKLAADLPAFTSTTLANATGLAFAVTSGVVCRFRFDVIFRTAALTTGIRLGLTCPAFTVLAANVTTPFAADGTGMMFEGAITTSGDSVLSTGVAAANADNLAVIEGVLLPSANGTLQLQAATEVAASAATVRAGSNGQLWTP